MLWEEHQLGLPILPLGHKCPLQEGTPEMLCSLLHACGYALNAPYQWDERSADALYAFQNHFFPQYYDLSTKWLHNLKTHDEITNLWYTQLLALREYQQQFNLS
jgi:hypothetical protein